ncbi:crossover junction endodeoxyribonuclease RuvC [Microbacterium kunmingense]|uniref:crossover junction endodeoxyribonuclease RuvC n=1 Tax=Microbacterium kunmingense TaxID=2915939 RepID=UPI003D74ED42
MTPGRYAVGVDPSLTCTGVAIIDTLTRNISIHRVTTVNTGPTLKARRDRMRDAIAGILAPIPRAVGVTLIEVPHSAHQFGAQNERVALYWWLVDQLLARGPVVEVAPSQRAKLATGNGRADKRAVLRTMRDAYPEVRVIDDNVADALALAAAGARWLGAPTQSYNDGQAAVYRTITWPTRQAIPTQRGA